MNTLLNREMAIKLLAPALLLAASGTALAQTADGSGASEAPAEATPAAEAPAAQAPAAQPAPTAAPAMDGGGTNSGRSASTVNYELRLRELEDRMNELKEDIFRSKSRLFSLREAILRSEAGGARAIIQHSSELSSTYTLLSVTYSLDGQQVLFIAADGVADTGADQVVYDGALLPGPHNLSVSYEVQGNDFGVFEYMEGYRIPVMSSYQFDIEEGQTIEIDAVLIEAGGVNTPLEERPDVRYDVDTVESTVDTSAEAN
jgi:hypothetical protein